MKNPSEPLYIGVGSHAVAIDRATGAELWRTKLKSSSFVTVYSDRDGLYAGAKGELFCLDRTTGSILWHNRLNGLGMNVITFSGSGTTALLDRATTSGPGGRSTG
ncbi:MAG TPA: PQQ-binding-like beta-propeller repeat protein [Thermoanaerobaculia bacterium]|nr:PQQ-binding-like beta-propeller repeat protein [Thermoanaerobaculia bacterium]